MRVGPRARSSLAWRSLRECTARSVGFVRAVISGNGRGSSQQQCEASISILQTRRVGSHAICDPCRCHLRSHRGVASALQACTQITQQQRNYEALACRALPHIWRGCALPRVFALRPGEARAPRRAHRWASRWKRSVGAVGGRRRCSASTTIRARAARRRGACSAGRGSSRAVHGGPPARWRGGRASLGASARVSARLRVAPRASGEPGPTLGGTAHTGWALLRLGGEHPGRPLCRACRAVRRAGALQTSRARSPAMLPGRSDRAGCRRPAGARRASHRWRPKVPCRRPAGRERAA